MAYASITYTSASGTTFALTNSSGDSIEYLRQADIKVFLNGTLQAITTNYTFNTAGTAIVFNTAVSGATVIIQRITDIDDSAVNFTPGSTLVASDLNNSSDQNLFALQELRDEISFGGGVSDGDKGEIVVASSGTIWSIDTGVITEAKLATAAVTETKIGTGAVIEAKLATGAVTATKIGTEAVTETKIGAAAVTEAKIGTGAVTSTKILNETILDIDINPSAAITGTKIQAATTSNVGAVQLTNSASSTSTTTAATPNAVKTAKDAADTAQSAANTAQSAADAAQSTANAALPKAGGTMTGVITYATAQPRLIVSTAVSASTAAVDFNGANGIPSWAKRVTLMFDNLSMVSTGIPLIRLGTSSGVETANYSSILSNTTATAIATRLSVTSGFETVAAGVATYAMSGLYILNNIDSNIWIITGSMQPGPLVVSQQFISGRKSLASTLTRLQVTTVGGTDTFDAGSINIMYEG
jgi:hypothetical protein